VCARYAQGLWITYPRWHRESTCRWILVFEGWPAGDVNETFRTVTKTRLRLPLFSSRWDWDLPRFLQRVHIACNAIAVIAVALSVCLSFCHIPVFCGHLTCSLAQLFKNALNSPGHSTCPSPHRGRCLGQKIFDYLTSKCLFWCTSELFWRTHNRPVRF